jgi:hypothetical protein
MVRLDKASLRLQDAPNTGSGIMLWNVLAIIGVAVMIKPAVRIVLTLLLVPFLILYAYVHRQAKGPSQTPLIPPGFARLLNLRLASALLWISEALVRMGTGKPWRPGTV